MSVRPLQGIGGVGVESAGCVDPGPKLTRGVSSCWCLGRVSTFPVSIYGTGDGRLSDGGRRTAFKIHVDDTSHLVI